MRTKSWKKEDIQAFIRKEDADRDAKKPHKKEKVKREPVDIQGGIKRHADFVIGEIEEFFDKYTTDWKDYSPYKHMVLKGVKPKHSKLIKDHALVNVRDYKEILSTNDEQLKEAYRMWSKPQLKNIIKWWKVLAEDCDRIVEDGKYIRRAKRELKKKRLVKLR